MNDYLRRSPGFLLIASIAEKMGVIASLSTVYYYCMMMNELVSLKT
jgi:hypothetical protein